MNIPFKWKNKTIWLTNDERQYITHEGITISINKDGSEKKNKINPHYFGKIENAVWFIRDCQIKQSEAEDLKALRKDIREIRLINQDELGF